MSSSSAGANRQLDLFAGAGDPSDHTAAPTVDRARFVVSELDDDALIAAIPHASVGDCRSLAAEAGRRRLVGATGALETLCRRFQGFAIIVLSKLRPSCTSAFRVTSSSHCCGTMRRRSAPAATAALAPRPRPFLCWASCSMTLIALSRVRRLVRSAGWVGPRLDLACCGCCARCPVLR